MSNLKNTNFYLITKTIALIFLFGNGWSGNSVAAQGTYTSLGNAPKKALNAYKDAQAKGKEKLYADAIKEYRKSITLAPDFIDAHYELAEILYLQKQYEAARFEYQKVTRLSKTYMPQALFTIGLLYEKEGDWTNAADYYEDFLALKRDPELTAKAKENLPNCRFRAYATENPVPFNPRNMGDSINSERNEYLPSLSLDGNTLMMTVEVAKDKEDFYKSTRKDGYWLPAENIGGPINTLQNEGAQTISADGKTMVFSACNRPDGLGSCDDYISEYRNGAWTTPVNMGAPINTKYWEGNSSLTADGRTLYFCSRRPGGLGNDDIWVATRKPDGSWNEPAPLGAPVNTDKAENAAFIHPDGRTLYFSSHGHAGMGRSDIFMSRIDSAGKWSEPLNLGYPINTAATEWSMIVAPDGKRAIYAAKRSDSRGGTDLYEFDLPEAVRAIPTTYLKGIVQNIDKQLLTNAVCTLTDLQSQRTVAEVRTDAEGSFMLPVPSDRKYSLHIKAINYLLYSDNFVVRGSSSALQPFIIQAFLQPILSPATQKNTPTETPKKAVGIVLKNVFFDTNKSILRGESEDELQRLTQLLLDNPQLQIQINGHTDNVGAAAANQLLSENRAKAVYNYLINHNIAASRLRYKGFGASQPLTTNDTDDGRQQNRRTEFLTIQ